MTFHVTESRRPTLIEDMDDRKRKDRESCIARFKNMPDTFVVELVQGINSKYQSASKCRHPLCDHALAHWRVVFAGYRLAIACICLFVSSTDYFPFYRNPIRPRWSYA